MKHIDIENNSKREIFNRFLANPDQADLKNVQELCEEFPYVSSLWFIYARISFLQQTPNAKEIYKRAALCSPNIEQLREFVFKPVDREEEIEFVATEEYDPEIDR